MFRVNTEKKKIEIANVFLNCNKTNLYFLCKQLLTKFSVLDDFLKLYTVQNGFYSVDDRMF